MAIKTNKLAYQIDYDELQKRYEFFKVSTSDDYFKGGASALDVPLLDNNVQSVLFERGNTFYVMMLYAELNKAHLRDVLLCSEEGNTISFEKVKPNQLADSVVIQLLFNGLGSVENGILRFNNLTGHVYCFHPEWVIHGKQASEDVIWKVPCLEIKITKDCLISLDVHTFTSELLKKKISFGKKRFEDYPQYVFSDRNTLRRKLKEDTETAFIQRQTDNAKKEITFLDIQNIDRFKQSKMGVLQEVLHQFNNKYIGSASVALSEVAERNCVMHHRKNDQIQNETIIKYLNEQPICIVDRINDSYSAEFCHQLVGLIDERYGVTARIGKRLLKQALNIVLIHNAAYYIDSEDPHNKDHNVYVVQHITFEDYAGNSTFALDTVIHELMIKRDLQLQKITLFDWAAYSFDKISFGLCERINDADRYFFMDISSDGSFNISEQELDLFNMNDYYRCLRIFEDAKTNGENVKGVIRDSSGQMNIIKDTGLFSIPEIDLIYSKLSSGNTKLRGKESRESLFSSCLDIKSIRFNSDDGVYYFVGDIGEGMRWSIQHAANIRKIERCEDSADMFSNMLPLMDVSFVRNGQLTVVPFPYKYIREWIKANIKDKRAFNRKHNTGKQG